MLKLNTERVNSEYFDIFKQIPLMVRLSLKARKGKNYTIKKILIINNALIGDFISSLPAMRYFIENNKAEIDLIVSPILEPLARHIRGVNQVFSAKSVYQRETERFRESNMFNEYDLVLVMQMSKDSYKMLKNIKYKKIKTSLLPYLRYGLHIVRNLSKKESIKQHEEFNLELIKAKELSKIKTDFDSIFRFEKEDKKGIANLQFLKNKKSKKVVIHTGSGWCIKLWKNERWVELLKGIRKLGNFDFIFVGGTEKEEKDFNNISKRLNFKVYSMIRKMDLKEIALMMRECDYFIGVDSGPRHIAHLLKIPSICLLGPGPKVFSPKGRNAVMIDKSDCYCTNFFCYRKNSCVEKITTDEVLYKFESIVKNNDKLH